MTMLYGNLADAALGERRFVASAHGSLKSAAQKQVAQKRAALKSVKPATRVLFGLALALIGLAALLVLGDAPDRFAAATPVLADLEHWLIWRDFQSY